jgi:hypothetical protein
MAVHASYKLPSIVFINITLELLVQLIRFGVFGTLIIRRYYTILRRLIFVLFAFVFVIVTLVVLALLPFLDNGVLSESRPNSFTGNILESKRRTTASKDIISIDIDILIDILIEKNIAASEEGADVVVERSSWSLSLIGSSTSSAFASSEDFCIGASVSLLLSVVGRTGVTTVGSDVVGESGTILVVGATTGATTGASVVFGSSVVVGAGTTDDGDESSSSTGAADGLIVVSSTPSVDTGQSSLKAGPNFVLKF